jgi:phytoene synthase
VAGTVGAMMALIMGARQPGAIARACDLGVAMQLSNIARDVGEDARAGRIYLPLTWLREAGIDADAWLRHPVFSPQLGTVVGRLLRAADRLYDRVGSGVAQLPPGCQPGINAARFLYAEVGREVERRGLDSVSSRAVVPVARKARLLTRALVAVVAEAEATDAPPLEECRFLVDAVANAPANAPGSVNQSLPVPEASEAAPETLAAAPREPVWWNLNDRVVWLIDLFERLERREHGGSAGSDSARS